MNLAAKTFLYWTFTPVLLTASGNCNQTGTNIAYDRGACLIESGQYEAAANEFRAYTATQPNDFKGWLMLSRAELHAKQFKAAHADAAKAVEVNPGSVEAYRSLGEADLELHQNQAAYEAWLKAHKLDAKDARIDYYIGRLFFEAEFWNESAAWLRQAYELAPHDYAVMTYLGMSADHLNFADTAIQLYNAAIDESNRQGKPYSWAYLAYAKHLHEQGHDADALHLLEEAERLCPEAHALAEEGQLLGATEPGRAESVLRRALSMDPAIPEAHYHLALLLRSKGQEQQAEHEFQEFRATRSAEQASKNSVQAIRRGS